MIIELNDDDTRLLHTVLLEQAHEHLSYADTSEVAERLYRLVPDSSARRHGRSERENTLQRGIAD